MSYNLTPPVSGDIVIVPLAHPNGAYIKLENNQKIYVLAKVRSGFSETINIINIFGYIYNVPLVHVERINYNIDTKFYTDMIENAHRVMSSFGYPALDNANFYDTSNGSASISYAFLSHLPGFSKSSNHSNVISPYNQPFIYQSDNSNTDLPIFRKKASNDNGMSPNSRKSDQGSVSVMDIDNTALLHVINRVGKDNIKFDKKSGVLIIPGYGTFIIDTSYTYAKTGDSVKYVLLKSHHNYIHIRQSKIHYVVIIDGDINFRSTQRSQYNVKSIRPKTQKPQYKKYFDIMKIIKNEF
jgi:hypothetical protein